MAAMACKESSGKRGQDTKIDPALSMASQVMDTQDSEMTNQPKTDDEHKMKEFKEAVKHYKRGQFAQRKAMESMRQNINELEEKLAEEKRRRAKIEDTRCQLCQARPIEVILNRCKHAYCCWTCWVRIIQLREQSSSWTVKCMKCRRPHMNDVQRIVYN